MSLSAMNSFSSLLKLDSEKVVALPVQRVELRDSYLLWKEKSEWKENNNPVIPKD